MKTIMIIDKNTQSQITLIYDKYIADDKKIIDNKGRELQEIDDRRRAVIPSIQHLIKEFIAGSISVIEFKSKIDSINKQNNLWGFTSVKGQMFFNLLVKNCDTDTSLNKLTFTLQSCISKPNDITDALHKVDTLYKYVFTLFNAAPDKRKAANPSSICYFLSYFWQVHDHDTWPIMYSSLVESFADLGLWSDIALPKDAYKEFYNLNEEIKKLLSEHSKKSISNWDAEHSFWSYKKVSGSTPRKDQPKPNEQPITIVNQEPISALSTASFNIYDYIPPINASLIELGNDTQMSGSAKGSKYEKLVSDIFKQLGFDTKPFGQGTGREPDLIAIHKEDNVAFIIDAKAYANGYMMSAGEERAIKEYINHHCPKLKREGIQRIGFIIVSNSFKSDFYEFINDITWNTDIKRFALLTSEALLHILAYRIKEQKSLSDIVDALVSLAPSIESHHIIEKFDDI